MLLRIAAFLSTREGIELSDRIRALIRKKEMGGAPDVRSQLTLHEETALVFIRKELKRGHSPSVREVTRALGAKSSRTGFRILQSLIGKGVLARRRSGPLMDKRSSEGN